MEGAEREVELSREDLLGVLEAVRAIGRASVDADVDVVLEAILGAVAKATSSDRAAIFLLDESRETLALFSGYPRADELTRGYQQIPVKGTPNERVIRDAVTVLVSADEFSARGTLAKTSGIAHTANVPISMRGKVAGTLALGRYGGVRYGPREVALAEMLGELLVVYLENAWHYADARRGAEEMRLLLDATRTIGASLELEARLDVSADVLARMLEATNAFIMLLGEDGTTLTGAAISNPAIRKEFRALRVPLTYVTPAGEAVKTRRAVVLDPTMPDEERATFGSTYSDRSMLALPLLEQGLPVGAVVIDDTRASRQWSRSEIARAELIAGSIAAGIANARLFSEVRARSVELERAQRELIKRERLAALGELAAIMAHEVRNPLAVLFNSLGSLSKLVPAEGDTAMLLSIMGEETRRLERLVRELLDFSRPRAPSFDTESVDAIIRSAALAASREIASERPGICIELAPDVPAVRVDASMIRRALVNLLVNALQATGEGGDVTVHASLVKRDGRPYVRIAVVDTGPGIPPAIAPRVFEPFFTTKATGTGLGLSVVKGIAESHGGDVELASSEDGTTVALLLPIEIAGS